jgi:methanol metabolism-related c-type cytochrome
MLVRFHPVASAAVAALLSLSALAYADGSGDPAAVADQDGKFADAAGNPTFKIDEATGTDWYTYSGYRRYHAECHTCHGPDGEGSSYAPALAQSLKTMPYADFQATVINGRVNVGGGHENVMPAFGTNPNVMCYLDDLYIYLRARANGAVNRGRPDKHAAKPAAFTEAETACMGR